MAKLRLNQQIFDLIYPVGSVYLTINDINPQTLFGGTWEKSSGGFIYGSTATGTKGENGNGSGTSTSSSGGGTTGDTALTVNQIPPHNHRIYWGQSLLSITGVSGSQDFLDLGSYSWAKYDLGSTTAILAGNTGGGSGHNHPLSNHSHNIPYFACYIWKRVA